MAQVEGVVIAGRGELGAAFEGVAQVIEQELAQVEGVVITSKMSPARCIAGRVRIVAGGRFELAQEIEQELAQVLILAGGRGRDHHRRPR